MSMFKVGNLVSRYQPFAKFCGDNVADMFSRVRIEKHCCKQPENISAELTLSIKGKFNGTSVYVIPSPELAELIKKVNMYGEPRFKDIYIKVEEIKGLFRFGIQYQQIIGSYQLFDLTEQQYRGLCLMAGLPVDIKRHPSFSELAFKGRYFVVNNVTQYAIESHPTQQEAESAVSDLNAHELRCQQAAAAGEEGAKPRQFYTYTVIEGDF
ncbi:hypothetical protein [Aeromonas phage BUCT552]|nr:hypothetical protein [Aeromonas phage BUCT552]